MISKVISKKSSTFLRKQPARTSRIFKHHSAHNKPTHQHWVYIKQYLPQPELQQQLPHPTQHMNTGDIIQINAPEFNPDIDGGPSMEEHGEIQGSDNLIQYHVGETKKSEVPALPQQVEEEVDWPDAVPVKIPPQSAQDNDYNISVVSTRPETNYSEIPELESDIDEEEEGQFEDIQTYLDHHNTYRES